jgi:dipeptidase E
MTGLSAGSLCWFEEGVSDSVVPGDLAPIKCVGFLKGSHCPHYDGEPQRRPAYHRFVQEGRLGAGYAADDGAALHFIGDELARRCEFAGDRRRLTLFAKWELRWKRLRSTRNGWRGRG